MPSTLAWLDTTSEERRLARELLSMFTQKEGRDEIGIGQVRDAFSDILFPGTSTLHTRSRYFLIVPWCYTTPSALRVTGDARGRAGRTTERSIISAMPQGEEGVIGARAGAAVKALPSDVYWGGLERYGILTRPTDRNHLDDAPRSDLEAATELADRAIGAWHPSLPQPPAEFPGTVTGGLNLRPEEAQWLSERILASVPGSLLAHLVSARKRIPSTSHFPWHTVDLDWGEPLRHAFVFSTAIHGAQLVYNLLVAREYEKNPELDRVHEPVAHYQERIEAWSEHVHAEHARLTESWSPGGMRALLHGHNPRIQPHTFNFILDWIDSTITRGPIATANDPAFQEMVARRERRKGAQSRLRNPKLLATWLGESAASQLTFRWSNVRRMVNDLL